MAKRARSGMEPLVVSAAELAAVLKRWMREHDALHPSLREDVSRATRVRKTYRLNGHEGGMKWGYSSRSYLRDHTNLEDRSIYRILNGEAKYVTLAVADELLTAIERTDVWDIEVHVVPNPRYSQEHWIEEMRKRGCA